MPPLRIHAPAKLNLFLHVTDKRLDGYHLLESLVAFTAFSDTLEIVSSKDITLDITGPFAPQLQRDGNENLILRAARLLQTKMGIKDGAHIILHKNIPVAAGLGGGSADAAAVLRGLQKLWKVEGDNTLAISLGSDVPVCMSSQPAYVRGVGEQVNPVDMKVNAGILLVNPGLPLVTVEVFKHFSQTFSKPAHYPVAIASLKELLALMRMTHNALETPAMQLLPVIGDVLRTLRATPECLIARMAGSGATCFGVYENEAKARTAAENLQNSHPTWWCMATRL